LDKRYNTNRYSGCEEKTNRYSGCEDSKAKGMIQQSVYKKNKLCWSKCLSWQYTKQSLGNQEESLQE